MKNIEILAGLIRRGQFHHATYRNIGTLWEGLHFYKKSETGFRGFEHAGMIGKNDPNLEEAYKLVSGTGISVGSYGRG